MQACPGGPEVSAFISLLKWAFQPICPADVDEQRYAGELSSTYVLVFLLKKYGKCRSSAFAGDICVEH